MKGAHAHQPRAPPPAQPQHRNPEIAEGGKKRALGRRAKGGVPEPLARLPEHAEQLRLGAPDLGGADDVQHPERGGVAHRLTAR